MNVTIAPKYTPHAQQARLHASKARFKAAAAGVRGGKSYGMGVDFYADIYRDLAAGKGGQVSGTGKRRRPRLHYWVVAPTFALLKEPLRYTFEIVPRELIEAFYESDTSLWLKPDILIEFKTADNPLNLVASGLSGLWIDEAARIKADAWRGQLRQRLTDKNGWAKFSTTPLGRNWLYEDVVAKSGQDGYETISWTTAENTFIPNIAEEMANAQATLPKRYFEREYLASFDAFTGTIFDEWLESLHVVSPEAFIRDYAVRPGGDVRTLFRRIIAGVDWGWNSAGAIVVVGDMGAAGAVVLEESYAANRIVFDPRAKDTWVNEAVRLRDKWGIKSFFCDPSAPGNLHLFSRSALSAVQADNDIGEGLRAIQQFMHPIAGKPRMYVLDGCTNLRREIPQYQWDQNRDRSGFVDLPAPNQSDHAIDALRYAMIEIARYDPTNPKAPPNFWGERKGPIA
jgi:hypothetical protein